MADRQRGELFGPAREECTAANHEPARSQLDQLCEDSIEVTFGAGIQDMQLQPEGTSRRLHLLSVGLGKSGFGWVDEERHDARRGNQLVQQLQQLWRYLHVRLVTPVTLPPGRLRLATRPSRTGSEPSSKTIGMVVVAAFAASAAGVLVAAITAT